MARPRHPAHRAIGRVLYHATKPWPAWSALLVSGLAAYLLMQPALRITEPSDQIRYTGAAFQLLGLAIVAVGIRNTRRMFGAKGIVELFLEWCRDWWVVWFGRVFQASVAETTVRFDAVGRGEVLAGPKASVEKRIEVLEQNLENVRAEVRKVRDELRTKSVTLERTMEVERRDRLDLRKLLEELSIGGLHLESVGLYFLIVGVVLATMPAEIQAVAVWIDGWGSSVTDTTVTQPLVDR